MLHTNAYQLYFSIVMLPVDHFVDGNWFGIDLTLRFICSTVPWHVFCQSPTTHLITILITISTNMEEVSFDQSHELLKILSWRAFLWNFRRFCWKSYLLMSMLADATTVNTEKRGSHLSTNTVAVSAPSQHEKECPACVLCITSYHQDKTVSPPVPCMCGQLAPRVTYWS
jgi:hypothetical protein